MLRKVVITEPGDSDFIVGEQAEFSKLEKQTFHLEKIKKLKCSLIECF